MPLGDRQENNLVHITLDVWQDKVYYLGKEYPAGYFAAGVLNASDDLIVNTVRAGEFLMNAYQLARIGGREELFELLPMLWDAVKKLLEALREVPPFSLWDMEEEWKKMEEMFSRNHLDKLVEDPIEREIFMIYLLGGIMIPMSVYHFVEAVRMFENCYLHRLGRRDETHFAVAFHDFYHAPDTKKLLENSYGRFLEPFEGNSEIKSSYCFAREPKDEKKMIFINRVMFPAYMDFYVYDLLNGMHWGHAPSQCECCLKFFLTTDSHKPKYCDGMAPQNPHYTCRLYLSFRHHGHCPAADARLCAGTRYRPPGGAGRARGGGDHAGRGHRGVCIPPLRALPSRGSPRSRGESDESGADCRREMTLLSAEMGRAPDL